MKNLLIITIIASCIAACSQNSETEETVSGRYGDTTWAVADVLTGAQMMDSLAHNDSIYATVSGPIKAACQAKGCWMNMEIANNEMFVKFKDYSFFVPKNSAEHNAIVKGWAYLDTLSVADQIEKAKDSEATAEEIAAITEPKVELTFMADGVIIE
jgi:hypothetical protein